MSPPSSHQTIRLARGRHHHPSQGACVVELASMLAGERFTDHPRSVCPVIAAFLRVYNDGIDDDRRRDLYEIAALIVGTRSGRRATAARRRLCRAFIDEMHGPSIRGLLPDNELIASECARAALRGRDHDRALRFVRELAAIDRRDDAGAIRDEQHDVVEHGASGEAVVLDMAR
jgi:hypothetical protein